MKNQNNRSGFNNSRVVHIHPSLFCNLFCKHCYSSSGPKIKEYLDIASLKNALQVLKKEGYQVISISGGEPLLYKYIEPLLKEGTNLGYRINLISNGGPINKNSIALLKKHVSSVAISLDGDKETHNFLRNSSNAFNLAQKGITRLVEAGINTGIAYGVSKASLSSMPWAVQFAEEMDCDLIQFHPFAAIGRGKLMPELTLNAADRVKAYTIANLFKDAQKTKVHIDLLPVENALLQKDDYQLLSTNSVNKAKLSDLVNPIIISNTGDLLPFCYGISDHYRIGELGNRLNEDILEWKAIGWLQTKELIEDAFTNLSNHSTEYVDWFYHILQAAKAESLV